MKYVHIHHRHAQGLKVSVESSNLGLVVNQDIYVDIEIDDLGEHRSS